MSSESSYICSGTFVLVPLLFCHLVYLVSANLSLLQLPDEAILSEVLEAPGVQDWFSKAAEVGDPDALFLALKMQERTIVQKEIFGKLLPYPFSSDNFFAEQHLKSIAACFKVLFSVIV